MTTISGVTSAYDSSASARQTGQTSLGQADFLTLLTAQMQNQDPLNPLDNAEFMGQMAQFSTVAGIGDLNAAVAGIASELRDSRLSAASSMVGRTVLVEGSLARPDADGAIRGAVALDSPVDGMVVTYSDAETGMLLHSQTLGPQQAGSASFLWADPPAEMKAANAPVRVAVSALRDGETQPVASQVYARVLSVSAAAGSTDLTLQVEGFGALNSLEIQSLR